MIQPDYIFDFHLLKDRNLYHYTDANGLLGIISDQELWGTNYKFLNDPSEHAYGFKVVKMVMEEKMSQINHMNLITAYELYFGKNPEKFFKRRFYLASLSEENDKLIQWVAYGNSGRGFAIQLTVDTRKFSPFNDFHSKIPMQLMKVIYEPSEQRIIAQKAIENFINSAPHELGLLCNYLCIKFKDKRYAHEKEWRIVESPVDNPIEYPQNMEYRESRGAIIDYCKFPMPKQITGVVVGPNRPLSDMEIVSQLMHDKLKAKPGTYPVTKSDVPFR